jgi:hypothetical protein
MPIIFFLALTSDESSLDVDESRINLLKFPYSYRAELTVASDTHTTSVEMFNVVYTLINAHSRIKNGYFKIDENGAWQEGSNGFGLPIADSMWLYARKMCVFAGFDENAGQPVP